MLQDAFDGKTPAAFHTEYDAGVRVRHRRPAAGGRGGAAQAVGMEMSATFFANENLVADVSTDDWPFFYMPARKYPVSYAVMIVALLVVAFVFVNRLMPTARRGRLLVALLSARRGVHAAGDQGDHRAGAVLRQHVGGRRRGDRRHPGHGVPGEPAADPRAVAAGVVAYGLLLAALGEPGDVLRALRRPAAAPAASGRRASLRTAIITLPLFFAGVAFSTELKRVDVGRAALSSNLLGAMLGGCLEYNAMYFGYRSLYVVAMAVYALALLTSLFSPARPQPGAARTPRARGKPVPAEVLP